MSKNTTDEYRLSVAGEGPLAHQWQDKPHRHVYDLCGEVERLKTDLDEVETLYYGGRSQYWRQSQDLQRAEAKVARLQVALLDTEERRISEGIAQAKEVDRLRSALEDTGSILGIHFGKGSGAERMAKKVVARAQWISDLVDERARKIKALRAALESIQLLIAYEKYTAAHSRAGQALATQPPAGEGDQT